MKFLIKRFTAFVIDGVVAIAISYGICGLISAFSTTTSIISFMQKELPNLIMLCKDACGQSLGKRVVGIDIRSDNGQRARVINRILRNFSYYIMPVEVISILISDSHQRLTDTLLHQNVIDE